MRKWLLLLMLLSPALVAQDQPLRLNVDGEITIDKNGNVYAYEIQTPVTDAVRGVIDRAVKKWRFEPVVREGSAVYAKSGMSMELVAVPVEKGLQLRIDEVDFETGRRSKRMTPPAYPGEAMRVGFEAVVLVALRIDGDGNVRDTFVVQSTLKERRRKTTNDRLSRVFEKTAAEAAKRWKFEPADLANGEEADVTAIVPVDFVLDHSALTASGWMPDEATGARRLIPWLPASEQDYDPTGLKNGEMLGLGDESVRLKTEVVGTVL